MSTCPQVDQYMRKEVYFDKSPRSDWPVVMPGWCQVLNWLSWKSWALSVPFSVASFNKKQHTQKMAKLGPSFSQTHPRGMPHPAAVLSSFVVDNSRMRLIFWTSPCASIEACRIWVISGKKKEPTFWTWGSHRPHFSVMFEDLCGGWSTVFFSFLRWFSCHSNASQLSLTESSKSLHWWRWAGCENGVRELTSNWWEMEFMQAALESFITVWRLVNCEDCVWKWHCQMSSNNLHSRLLDLWPLSPTCWTSWGRGCTARICESIGPPM